MLAAPYRTGGKNEQEEVASLGVVFGRLSLGRMRNGSWHGGRYTEHRKSRKEDRLWRIGRDLIRRWKHPQTASDEHRA